MIAEQVQKTATLHNIVELLISHQALREGFQKNCHEVRC